MIFVELLDLILDIYTSLGYKSKQQKIASKMRKLAKDYPELYEIYIQNRDRFEADEEISKKILKLNTKNKKAINHIVRDIYTRFNFAI